ncbi:MAG: hypothetical protein EOO28_12200 [Comamonadaceae bacterium]|nr:MAG: hypothetical protein EOO28_12200 [Comamonadaceae bacterium]
MGAVLGGLACVLRKSRERAVLIENVLVGVFGAYIGGDFLSTMIPGGNADASVFSMRSLGLSAAGSIALLLCLGLMRRKVGPMRPAKRPRRRE